MIQSIGQYLSLLKKELSECDRATIQDALADTEEHLTTALDSTIAAGNIPETAALARIIEEYGLPEEVARAYREAERHLTPPLAPASPTEDEEKPAARDSRPFPVRFFGVFTDPRTWGAFFYLLFSLATGIVYFTWAVTGLSLSVGLLVLVIGLPLAALFILSIRVLGLVEGRLVEALLGVRMPRRPLFSGQHLTLWQRCRLLFTDRHTWLSLLYMIMHLPLGVFYFTLLVTLLAVAAACIATPFIELAYGVPLGYFNGVVYQLAGWTLPFIFIIGVLLIILTMHLARFLGRQHGRLAKFMLVRG